MKNLKNRLTANVISFLVIGGSCLPTMFADGPNDDQNLPGFIHLSYGHAIPLGLKCDILPDEYCGVAPAYGTIPQPGEYKKNPRPPRSERKEDRRYSKPQRLFSHEHDGQFSKNESGGLPISMSEPENDSFIVKTVPSREELERKYPNILCALYSYTDIKEKEEPLTSVLYCNQINRDYKEILRNWNPENKGLIKKRKICKGYKSIEPLLGKEEHVNRVLSLSSINSKICGLVRKAVQAKRKKEIYTQKLINDIENSIFKLKSARFPVDSDILKYVNSNYIHNRKFLKLSKELCPSVTSYVIVACIGTPWFVKYILDDVKKQPSLQNVVNRDNQLFNLARNLQRMFLGTLVYRLHQEDIPKKTIGSNVVRYVGDVEIDSPISPKILVNEV